MDDPKNLLGIPVQYQVYVVGGGIALKYLSEFYSSVRAGGGLKRIVMSFWFGEQTPKVICDDYRAELSSEKPPATKPSPQSGPPPIKWF